MASALAAVDGVTAVYSIAAPAGGWAEGAYTATVAGNEVSDLADTPNLNVGGETADVTLSFEDEPVVEFTRGDVKLAINAGGGVVDGTAYGLGDVDFEGDTAANPHPTVDDVHEALAGNLCRCAGYEQIAQAVLAAAAAEEGTQ